MIRIFQLLHSPYFFVSQSTESLSSQRILQKETNDGDFLLSFEPLLVPEYGPEVQTGRRPGTRRHLLAIDSHQLCGNR